MDQQQQQSQDLIHREMYRRSQDDCMIYNPTGESFYILWEPGLKFEVPGKDRNIGWGNGQREVKRYLAEWYLRHMKDHIINKMEADKVKELLALRPKGEDFVTKYHENQWLLAQVPKTNDPKLIEELYQVLFLGVTHEFGMDLPDNQSIMVNDGKTQEERIMEELNNKKYTETVAPPLTVTLTEATPYEKKVANLAKAREAKKLKTQAII